MKTYRKIRLIICGAAALALGSALGTGRNLVADGSGSNVYAEETQGYRSIYYSSTPVLMYGEGFEEDGEDFDAPSPASSDRYAPYTEEITQAPDPEPVEEEPAKETAVEETKTEETTTAETTTAETTTTTTTTTTTVAETYDPQESASDIAYSLRQEIEGIKLRLDKAERKPDGKRPTDRFTVKFGGMIKMDGTIVSQSDRALANFGNAKNSVGMRDIRFLANGSGYGHLQYSLGFSFNDAITLRHAYVRVKDTKYLGDITMGHFFVESGMESVQTSYERVFAMPDDDESFFGLGRRFGASTTFYGADKRSRAFFGVFAAASVATAPERLNGEGSGLVLNGRYTTTPIFVEDADGFTREVLHLGASYYWLDPAHTAPLVSRTRGTGWTGTNPYFLSGLRPLDGLNYSVLAAELAYQKEGFSAMGEGYFRSVEKGGNAYGLTVSARHMLTPNAVRVYNRTDARFGGVKMRDDVLFLNFKDRVIGGNLGAIEAVAKWEWTQANDVKFDACDITQAAPPIYGTVNRAVTGFNWFWNEQMNWAFNWEHAFVNSRQAGKKMKGDFDTLLIQTSIKF